MNFNNIWLNRKRGIIVTFLWSVYGFFILYKNGTPKIQGLSTTEVDYIMGGTLLLLTLSFLRQVIVKGVSDWSKYTEPPFATIETIIDNKVKFGVQAAFIGSPPSLLKTSEFAEVYSDYKNLKRSSLYYNYAFQRDSKLAMLNPRTKLVAVKYSNKKYQFSTLNLASNQQYLAVQFLKKLNEEGVQVEGEYEHLKNTPEQFNKKTWTQIYILIAIGTLIFIILSVIAVGIIDGNI